MFRVSGFGFRMKGRFRVWVVRKFRVVGLRVEGLRVSEPL